MYCLLLTLPIVILITSSLTIQNCEPNGDKQNTTSPSGSGSSPPYCPCPLNTAIPVLGYSPCLIHNFISPRKCDAYIQVALQNAFASLIERDDLRLFSNYCFFPFPFNENKVSFLKSNLGIVNY